MPNDLLSNPPECVRQFAAEGEFNDGETVVGFFAETVPDGAGRVRPEYWVVVTTQGLYSIDPQSECVVRARMLHNFAEDTNV